MALAWKVVIASLAIVLLTSGAAEAMYRGAGGKPITPGNSQDAPGQAKKHPEAGPPAPLPPAAPPSADAPARGDPARRALAPTPTTQNAASSWSSPLTAAKALSAFYHERAAVNLTLVSESYVPAVSLSGGEAPHSAPAPWTWAVPLVGALGLGAVLVSLRKQRVEVVARPARPRQVGPTSAGQERSFTLMFAAPDVPSLLKAGKSAIERSELAEAIAWFDQALKLDPRLAVAHFCRGVCLSTMRRHEEAYDALLTAYELDPEEAAIRLEFARAAARLHRTSEALRALSPLLSLVPELSEDILRDEAFTTLHDHPRFLALAGRL